MVSRALVIAEHLVATQSLLLQLLLLMHSFPLFNKPREIVGEHFLIAVAGDIELHFQVFNRNHLEILN